MIAKCKNWFIAFYVALVSLGANAGYAIGPGDSGDFVEYINNALKVTQYICLALGVFAGMKIFTLWMSGSEEGGRDKGAIIKWMIGIFIIVAFFAFVAFLETQVGTPTVAPNS